MYSFSTCWNSQRHTDGRAMLREIRDLGFDHAELSHGIRISLLPGILEAVDAGEIKISTLHNFCPLPMGVTQAAPNIYLFSSPDDREWESAYKHSIKTIETAARVGARAVVLHMGCIEMKDYTDKLVDLVGKGKKESPKYEKLCNEVQEKIQEKKEKFVERSYRMLRRLIEPAEARGIKLAVENREALEEIPIDSDFSFFFREFPEPTVCYWHDTG
ncbi:MAG: TIM barrel protein, partial [Verrucomicrobiota bacterium]